MVESRSSDAQKRNRAQTSQINGNKQDDILIQLQETGEETGIKKLSRAITVAKTTTPDMNRETEGAKDSVDQVNHSPMPERETGEWRCKNPEQSSNIVNAKSIFICFLWLTNLVVASFFLSSKTKFLKTNRLVFFESIGVIETLSSPQISVTVAAMATTKLYVVYYSLYRHVEIMAREVQRGANSVQGVEATIWQVPETLSDIILQKMKAPAKAGDVPEIRPEQLLDADGFLFGFPSRFGVMAAQFKAFFDATSELWKGQALAGKPAGIFWSTGFHGGGQELTALTAITQLAHHGMIFVPLGYTFGSGMFEMDEVKGGSAYGAGTYAADGSREPTELELQQAFHQGKYVAEITKKLKNEPLSP
ncbi:hypothetical protein V6N11_026339 [Hibiscus sabdariffa]|uniref:NAD(P)H dehydrogenase (quinone) n=1 Tax=Hibiscus sabdariffa TaxID=183260 RepID=A0ABR2SVD6_9ROSI